MQFLVGVLHCPNLSTVHDPMLSSPRQLQQTSAIEVEREFHYIMDGKAQYMSLCNVLHPVTNLKIYVSFFSVVIVFLQLQSPAICNAAVLH